MACCNLRHAQAQVEGEARGYGNIGIRGNSVETRRGSRLAVVRRAVSKLIAILLPE